MSTPTSDDAIRARKAQLREEAKARRAALPRDQAEGVALAVRDRILAAGIVPEDATVSGFWPIGDEFDVRPTLEAFGARGHTLCLPVVVGKGRPLAFRTWKPGDPLEHAGFGLSVPRWDAPPAVPDFLLVPLLAFDRRGYRLGYGGGYFDRTLAALDPAPLCIGVAFELARTETTHPQPHDQPMDWIVTEAGSFRAAARPDFSG